MRKRIVGFQTQLIMLANIFRNSTPFGKLDWTLFFAQINFPQFRKQKSENCVTSESKKNLNAV